MIYLPYNPEFVLLFLLFLRPKTKHHWRTGVFGGCCRVREKVYVLFPSQSAAKHPHPVQQTDGNKWWWWRKRTNLIYQNHQSKSWSLGPTQDISWSQYKNPKETQKSRSSRALPLAFRKTKIVWPSALRNKSDIDTALKYCCRTKMRSAQSKRTWR